MPPQTHPVPFGAAGIINFLIVLVQQPCSHPHGRGDQEHFAHLPWPAWVSARAEHHEVRSHHLGVEHRGAVRRQEGTGDIPARQFAAAAILDYRTAFSLGPSEHPARRHPRTMLGTTPRTVTWASRTNSQKPGSTGPPSYRAMVARLSSPANTSHGPIIHPRLVGQHNTSPGRRSWCQWPSPAALMGVTCSQGIAFGSPVVPEENSTLMHVSGSQAAGSN